MRSNKPRRPSRQPCGLSDRPLSQHSLGGSRAATSPSPSMMLHHLTAAMHLAPLKPSMPSSKVAIPRVSPARSLGNGRLKLACIESREQKTKCNGHQPCGCCTGLGVECVYANGKREAIQKQLKELENQAQAYNLLLTDTAASLSSPSLGRAVQVIIRGVLTLR
ncbi:hypothetical protein BDV10DRAFT_179344 [Aspergillus recurvatus]